jgi:hypothetical protein
MAVEVQTDLRFDGSREQQQQQQQRQRQSVPPKRPKRPKRPWQPVQQQQQQQQQQQHGCPLHGWQDDFDAFTDDEVLSMGIHGQATLALMETVYKMVTELRHLITGGQAAVHGTLVQSSLWRECYEYGRHCAPTCSPEAVMCDVLRHALCEVFGVRDAGIDVGGFRAIIRVLRSMVDSARLTEGGWLLAVQAASGLGAAQAASALRRLQCVYGQLMKQLTHNALASVRHANALERQRYAPVANTLKRDAPVANTLKLQRYAPVRAHTKLTF